MWSLPSRTFFLVSTISIVLISLSGFVSARCEDPYPCPGDRTSTTTLASTSSYTVTVTATPTAIADINATYTDDNSFRDAVLKAHNDFRETYNASTLSWNDSLADFGQEWADGCQWNHSDGPNGENLASGYSSPTLAVTAWANESHAYNFGDPGFSENTGHFTQLVWKATHTVGCGRTFCGDGDPEKGEANNWYLVCEYYPPGNVEKQYALQVSESLDKKGSASGMTVRAPVVLVATMLVVMIVEWI